MKSKINADHAVLRENSFPAYTADGYHAREADIYTINRAFIIRLASDTYPDSFNRFTIQYMSTEPLLCTVAYSENGTEIKDRFFLKPEQIHSVSQRVPDRA